MLLEQLQEHSQRVDLSNVEVGLFMYVDEEDDNVGCYYLCNTKTEEVFYLAEVSRLFFSDTENTPIVSRDHLSESVDVLKGLR